MHTIFTLQKSVGIFSLNQNGRRFHPSLVSLLIVHDFVGKAMALSPASVHPIEHLAPILRLGAASARLKAHQGVVFVVMSSEERLNTAGLHLLSQLIVTFLQFLQHGVIIFLGGHLADGHHVVPTGAHTLVFFNFRLRNFRLHHDLLALLRVIPESGSLLHRVIALQLVAKALQIQGIRQSVQRGLTVVELLFVSVKFNIHSHTLISSKFHSLDYYIRFCLFCKGGNSVFSSSAEKNI